jgi:hypothetical protein
MATGLMKERSRMASLLNNASHLKLIGALTKAKRLRPEATYSTLLIFLSCKIKPARPNFDQCTSKDKPMHEPKSTKNPENMGKYKRNKRYPCR